MISIVMTARERYALTPKSVVSILSGLNPSILVVFVAGKAPAETLSFLKQMAKKHKRFVLVKRDRYLEANEARQIGLSKVPGGSDVVFIENDVVAKKGWLQNLLKCARECKADIVSPLVFEGDPDDPDPPLHIAGANFVRSGSGEKSEIIGLDHFFNHERFDWRRLRRNVFDVVEFHCLFIRRKCLDQIVLDGRFSGLFSHLDLCLQARQWGAKVMVEPKAHVVFANPAMVPLSTLSDFEFFAHQWGEKACRTRAIDFGRKWGMDPKGPLLWKFREWCSWNRGMVLSRLRPLRGPGRWVWKATLRKACPEWFREMHEKYRVARIRIGGRWA